MTVAGDPARKALLRRGFALEYVTLAWNVAGLAVLAVAARSVALAGFGLDSLIEIGASTVVIWELSGTGQARQRRGPRSAGNLLPTPLRPPRWRSCPAHRPVSTRLLCPERQIRSKIPVVQISPLMSVEPARGGRGLSRVQPRPGLSVAAVSKSVSRISPAAWSGALDSEPRRAVPAVSRSPLLLDRLSC